jgi:O-methyltransferase
VFTAFEPSPKNSKDQIIMKKQILKLIGKVGYTIVKTDTKISDRYFDIKEPEFWDIYNLCKPYTMTSVERMYALYSSVNYVLANDIKGDFVECGVWRGGSAMMIAKILHNKQITNRKIYLYDTFEGMTEPTDIDVDLKGKSAKQSLKEIKETSPGSIWCVAHLVDVKNNMSLTNFPEDKLVYVKGKVEDTIPQVIPDKSISLLRLDTDWYESTKHELVNLYPNLEVNGILIIDDYGHWAGCKKAVDEYLKEYNITILLNRVDYSGRVAIKTANV